MKRNLGPLDVRWSGSDAVEMERPASMNTFRTGIFEVFQEYERFPRNSFFHLPVDKVDGIRASFHSNLSEPSSARLMLSRFLLIIPIVQFSNTKNSSERYRQNKR